MLHLWFVNLSYTCYYQRNRLTFLNCFPRSVSAWIGFPNSIISTWLPSVGHMIPPRIYPSWVLHLWSTHGISPPHETAQHPDWFPKVHFQLHLHYLHLCRVFRASITQDRSEKCLSHLESVFHFKKHFFHFLLSMLSWELVSQQLPTFPRHRLHTRHALKVRITLPSSSTLTDLWGLEQHMRLWYRLIFRRCSTSTTHLSSLLFWSYRTTAFVWPCKLHSKSRSFVIILTFLALISL